MRDGEWVSRTHSPVPAAAAAGDYSCALPCLRPLRRPASGSGNMTHVEEAQATGDRGDPLSAPTD